MLPVHGTSSLQVNALQLHGTGTSLGDPIEMNAALTSLATKGGLGVPLSISAHKAATGHTEPAAGCHSLFLCQSVQDKTFARILSSRLLAHA